jgi:hypothetical protein
MLRDDQLSLLIGRKGKRAQSVDSARATIWQKFGPAKWGSVKHCRLDKRDWLRFHTEVDGESSQDKRNKSRAFRALHASICQFVLRRSAIRDAWRFVRA